LRTSTFARAGAVLTASALAFTLGTGPASAADDTTTTTTFSTVPDAQAKVDWANAGRARAAAKGGDVTAQFAVNPDLKTFAFATKNQVLADPNFNPLYGTIAVTPGNPGTPSGGYSMATLLKYYGSTKGYVPLYEGFATKEPFGGTPIPDTFGPGLYSFGPTRIYDPSNGALYFQDTTPSNTIRVRNATKGSIVYTKYYSSRKHKVTIHAQVYRPSANIFAGGISSVRLQYKSGSTWKAYKTIKLNKYGKASYTWYTSTKRTYRVLVPTTLSIQGDSDKGRYF
jgi:hypothetical protein